MAYCSQSDVERYITLNVGADVSGAIAAAQEQVNEYTGDLFEPVTKTVYAEGNRLNVVDLPYTTQEITSVVSEHTGTALSENMWTLYNGKYPHLRIGSESGSSLLIAGFEPYSSGRPLLARVNVTGTFGTLEVPAPIREATALLAANFLSSIGQGTLTSDAEGKIDAPSDVSSISVEGYSVTYRDVAPASLKDSTGLTTVDRMISSYRRNKRVRVF